MNKYICLLFVFLMYSCIYTSEKTNEQTTSNSIDNPKTTSQSNLAITEENSPSKSDITPISIASPQSTLIPTYLAMPTEISESQEQIKFLMKSDKGLNVFQIGEYMTIEVPEELMVEINILNTSEDIPYKILFSAIILGDNPSNHGLVGPLIEIIEYSSSLDDFIAMEDNINQNNRLNKEKLSIYYIDSRQGYKYQFMMMGPGLTESYIVRIDETKILRLTNHNAENRVYQNIIESVKFK